MTDRALLEQILSHQETILEALRRNGLLPPPRLEDAQELSDARTLAAICRADPASYRAEMRKRKQAKGKRRAA